MSDIIPLSWEVPSVFRDRLGNEYGRQRLMSSKGHLLLILHELPTPGKPEREGVLFWRNPQAEWQTTRPGNGKTNLYQFIEDYSQAIDTLEAEIEKEQTARSLFDIQKAVTPISRSLKHIYNVFQKAREAQPDCRELIVLRDKAYGLDRASDLLQADVKAAIDFEMAEQAEIQSKISLDLAKSGHRLNLLAAVFLPLTAITSVFGMSFSSGLDTKNPIYFWVILTSGIILGFFIKNALLKRCDTDLN